MVQVFHPPTVNLRSSIQLLVIIAFQLASVYNNSDPDYDYMQFEEERLRMREHVMKEVDKDEDDLVSLKEFIEYSNTDAFANPDKDSFKVSNQFILDCE